MHLDNYYYYYCYDYLMIITDHMIESYDNYRNKITKLLLLLLLIFIIMIFDDERHGTK
jgi:hypothetical protein